MSERAHVDIVRCRDDMLEEWLTLRRALWPHRSLDDHRGEVRAAAERPDRNVGLLARSGDTFVGLAEAALRSDYVNGCSSSPVVFLEALYVRPGWRRRGVARRLCRTIEVWGADLGCREFASDAALTNGDGQRAHRALGFEETERVVFYRKTIGRSP